MQISAKSLKVRGSGLRRCKNFVISFLEFVHKFLVFCLWPDEIRILYFGVLRSKTFSSGCTSLRYAHVVRFPSTQPAFLANTKSPLQK